LIEEGDEEEVDP